MITAGVAMFKDEADVAAAVVRHMAGEVDALLIADNGSTDGTREILAELASSLELPMVVVDDRDPAYYQSAKMSALAAAAHDTLNADWIVPFDADEVWVAHTGRIREVCATATPNQVMLAPLFNHYCTALDDEAQANPFQRMVWRAPEPLRMAKVAFRYEAGAVIAQGNHSVTLPSGALPPAGGFIGSPLEVRHFPVRSHAQILSKARNGARAYAATDLPAIEGHHWRGWGALIDRYGDAVMARVFDDHYYYRSPMDAGLVRDPAPWCRWPDD